MSVDLVEIIKIFFAVAGVFIAQLPIMKAVVRDTMRKELDRYETKETSESYNTDILGDLALNMDEIIKEHQKVDWHDNLEIHNRIAQELDDLLFDFKDKYDLDIDFDTIDKIIEQIKTVALRRY